jgi:hypothetical protein
MHFEEIKKGTSSDVICTVFETINTTGKRLTIFDLLVARCLPHKMNLREMLEAALDRVSIKIFDPEGEGIAPTALPRIVALKAKETARRGDILELDAGVFKEYWGYAVDALETALELMCDRYGCFGERFIPLVDMVAPLAIIITSEKFRHTDDHMRMLDRHAAINCVVNTRDVFENGRFVTKITDTIWLYTGIVERQQLKTIPREEIEDHHIYQSAFWGHMESKETG